MFTLKGLYRITYIFRPEGKTIGAYGTDILDDFFSFPYRFLITFEKYPVPPVRGDDAEGFLYDFEVLIEPAIEEVRFLFAVQFNFYGERISSYSVLKVTKV